MKRLFGLGLLTLVAASGQLVAQSPTFELGFASGLCGSTLERVSPGGGDVLADATTVECTLTTSENPSDTDGAQGWSISLAAENLSIVDITTLGSVGADANDGGLRNTGFEKSELTTGGGNEGAVSAVVLSFTMPITLAAEGSATIAVVQVQGGAFPSGDPGTAGSARLFYVDGRQGAGQPVTNNVTWRGTTVSPVLGECSIDLAVTEVPPVCPNLDVTNSVQFVWSDASLGQVAEVAPGVASTEEAQTLEAAPGEVTVYGNIASNGLASGVQGWSLSIRADAIVAASTDGTVGADVSQGGIRNTGFEKTELVDPSVDGQGAGAVSAVVCSFTMPITLDPTGTASVVAITLQGALGETTSVALVDGLRGSGQPVANVTTIGGGTSAFFCTKELSVTFAEAPVAAYIAGDPNSDGKINLADVIFIVNALFRGGPQPPCPAAADVNGDGSYDLSDATALIDYQWMGGSAPVGPAACDDAQPEITPEQCPAGSTVCS